MDKKKIIGLIILIVIIILLFLFRTTIYNNINSSRVNSVSKHKQADYQITFLNEVENYPDGSGFSFNSDLILIFIDEKKIINEKIEKTLIPFAFGNNYYRKIKIKDLDIQILDTIRKFETKKYSTQNETPLTANNGDIQLTKIEYDISNNIDSIKEYFIPNSNNSELHQILEKIK